MTRLPIISGKEVVKAFEKIGYRVVRQKGSHMRLRNIRNPKASPITVPDHKEIKPGLLRRIIKDAGLTVEEFIKLL